MWNSRIYNGTRHSGLSGRKSENNLETSKIDEKTGFSKNATYTWLNKAILL